MYLTYDIQFFGVQSSIDILKCLISSLQHKVSNIVTMHRGYGEHIYYIFLCTLTGAICEYAYIRVQSNKIK